MRNYCRDEPSNPLSCNSGSFKYKTNITRNTYDGDDYVEKVGENENEVVIPLKQLSNFGRTLKTLLLNC